MFGVDERRRAPGFLHGSDGVQGERRLATGLGPVDLDDAAARVSAGPEGDVETHGASRHGWDVIVKTLTLFEPHDRTLAVLFFDAGDGEFEGGILLLQILVVAHWDASGSTGRERA